MQDKHKHLKWKLSLAPSLFYYQASSLDMPQGTTFLEVKLTMNNQLMRVLNFRGVWNTLGMAADYQKTQQIWKAKAK